jgi:hypothetical protein
MTSPIVCTGDPDGAQRHAPYASVSCVRAKLRWPLSLGSGCRDYVRCVQVFTCSVYSRVQPTCLTTCPYRVCLAVTRLGPPGFSRGSPELFYHPSLKAERRYLTRDNNSCQHFGELVPTLYFLLNTSHDTTELQQSTAKIISSSERHCFCVMMGE